MHDLTRSYSIVFSGFLVILTMLCAPQAFAKSKTPSYNAKYASIVLDAETGKVLSEKYADKIVHPASLTKMMTMYMVFRELEAGRMTLDKKIVVSKHAASRPPSKAGVPAGQSVRVKDALGVVVTQSANDLATALGEAVSGSEPAFAKDMTKVAHAMGMTNTRFKNASGLPDKGQVTSARDMAILARALLYHYPQYYYFFGLKNYSFNGRSYHSHNRLMNTFAGMDGIKTGFINDSGFNLVASAKRDGRRLIGVVFGGRSWQTRNNHMAELLNVGFDKAGPGERPRVQEVNYQPQKALPVTPAPVQQTQVATAQPIQRILSEQVNAAPQQLRQGMISPSHDTTATNTPLSGGMWAIQIGAFSNQTQTENVVRQAATQLSSLYTGAQPLVVPFQTNKGIIYRARITGLSQTQAVEACRAMPSCLVVQPNG